MSGHAVPAKRCATTLTHQPLHFAAEHAARVICPIPTFTLVYCDLTNYLPGMIIIIEMDKKQRYSRQREVILEVLRGTTTHPTAEGVYESAKKHLPRLSLGTVYRNLRFLAERGEVLELDLNTESSRYDGNVQNHGHFVCQRCSRVLDVDLPAPEELNHQMERSTGLKVLSHKIAFYGLCLDCQAEDRKNGKRRL